MTDIVAKNGAIYLGHQGENLVTRVVLPNIREGAGTIALLHQRPGDATPYLVSVTESADHVYWAVTSVDTAAANFGRAELQWLGEDGEVLKSKIYRTYTEQSLTAPGPAPDPWEDLAGQVAASADAAKKSEAAAARYADTAYKAGTAATESAERAAGSASAAAESEENAAASAQQATSAATGAVASASAAAASATDASSAAQDAAAALKALEDGIAAGDFKGDKGDPGADGKDAPQIDDTAISAANPWSSKHIVDMLCPPLEESGNPVQCYPVPGYPLGVVVSWEPTQEGTGDPSPENVRPISGRRAVTVKRSEENLQGETLNLTLPEMIYGGEVDAVSGDGQGKWVVAVFDGSEAWMVSGKFLADNSDWYYVSPKIPGAVNESPQKGNNICSHYPYAVVTNKSTVKGCAIVWGAIRVRWGDTIPDNADNWKEYLSAQYAAGTPVQIAYKLATPVPFSATGAQPIHALPGVNTILTDADTVTVTGRADPIKRITDLEDAVASITTEG